MEDTIDTAKEQMLKELEHQQRTQVKQFIGVNVQQQVHVKEAVKKFRSDEAAPVSTSLLSETPGT